MVFSFGSNVGLVNFCMLCCVQQDIKHCHALTTNSSYQKLAQLKALNVWSYGHCILYLENALMLLGINFRLRLIEYALLTLCSKVKWRNVKVEITIYKSSFETVGT